MLDDDDAILEPPLGSGGASGGAPTSAPKGGAVGFGGTPVGFGGTTTLTWGGTANAGSGLPRGGYGNVGGVAGAGGQSTGGKAGAPPKSTGGIGGIGGGGGMSGAAAGGVAGASVCNPSRSAPLVGVAGAASAPSPYPIGGISGLAGMSGIAGMSAFAGTWGIGGASDAGAAGTTNHVNSDWYVDAKFGSDTGAGTLTSPLRTLACAAKVARSGETVRLLDGTWDATVDPKLADYSTTSCGTHSGIAFAPNVTVRAVNAGAAQIKASGYHAVCMSGGNIDGIRFTCGLGRPAIEANTGSLSISNTDFTNCPPFALEVSGNASVTLQPGTLLEYLGGDQVGLAYVRDDAALTVEGGKISYQARAFLVEGNASLTLHGVRTQPPSGIERVGPAVELSSGTPHLTVTGNTVFDGASIAVLSYSATSTILVDGMTVTHGGNAFIISEQPGSFVPKIVIDHLTVSDSSGLGVSVSGNYHLSLTNSSIARLTAPAVLLSGTGTVVLDNTQITNVPNGLIISGNKDTALGLAARVRNLTITGSECLAVYVDVTSSDQFDFGTASSPGNNVFKASNVGVSPSALCANLVFNLPSGMILPAVGNTWDANQQSADPLGHYVAASGALLVSGGSGPNYSADERNLGMVMLAGSL